jgi:hypothetical protein
MWRHTGRKKKSNVMGVRFFCFFLRLGNMLTGRHIGETAVSTVRVCVLQSRRANIEYAACRDD